MMGRMGEDGSIGFSSCFYPSYLVYPDNNIETMGGGVIVGHCPYNKLSGWG